MEIVFVQLGKDDFNGLDFFSQDKEDRLFVESLLKAYEAGDLNMSIDQSCLLTIGYGGKERSFQIKEKECKYLQEKLQDFWRGELSIKIGLFPIWNSEAQKFLKGFRIRFVLNKRIALQRRLIKSYIPPPIKSGKTKFLLAKK